MKKYSLFESTSNIIRFILVVTFILFDPSIKSFFYALSLHHIFVTVFVFILLSRNYKNQNERMGFVDYLRLSKSRFYKIRIDQAVGLIPTHLDVVVIGYFSNYYSAGIYRIAKKLVDPINYLIVAFSPWMLNKISSNNSYNFADLVKKILIPASILIFGFYYFFGIQLIELIVGDEFSKSYTPMLILVIGYLSYFLTFWTRHYLFLNNLIRKHTIARLINLLVFLIGSTFLINLFSFNGIALAVTSGTIIQKLYEYYIYFINKNSTSNS
jgi:O-antigen/teichoic acid export membrane protein